MTSRVPVERWVRYRIAPGTALRPPRGAYLTPVDADIIETIRQHPDAAQPDLASGLKFWQRGLRDGYVWFLRGEPVCFQWVLTEQYNDLLRSLPVWANMYPPIPQGVVFVEKLWAFTPFRGTGRATQFGYLMCDELRRRGVREVRTHIHEHNAPARIWARRTGWDPYGFIDRYEFDLPALRDRHVSLCVHSSWSGAAHDSFASNALARVAGAAGAVGAAGAGISAV
jgi:hypothetical protein